MKPDAYDVARDEDDSGQPGEAWAQLLVYCAALPRDSFVSIGLDGHLKFEFRGRSRHPHRASLTLPAACALRGRFFSEWRAGSDECREEVARNVLAALEAAGLWQGAGGPLVDDGAESNEDASAQAIRSALGEAAGEAAASGEGDFDGDGGGESAIDAAEVEAAAQGAEGAEGGRPAAEAHVYTLSFGDGTATGFGVLCGRHGLTPRFDYGLVAEGHSFRLMLCSIPCREEEHLEIASAYHSAVMGQDGGLGPHGPPLRRRVHRPCPRRRRRRHRRRGGG